MQTQALLNVLTTPTTTRKIVDTSEFIDYLRTEAITSLTDPFERLVRASMPAASQANAGIAGHQSAVRRLFQNTPLDAITAFCVSEKRGPHPRYIETQLEIDGNQARISGEKMWGTMAPAATLLYVAASTGVIDGQNQLRMVGVSTKAPGITQLPLPPDRQVGGVPICDLRFEATPVDDQHSYPEDAYEFYIKPFRLVEDVFSTVATQISLQQLGQSAGLSQEQREDLLGLIVQGHAVAESAMDAPGDILLLTSYLRASQVFWSALESRQPYASTEFKTFWRTNRPILAVAAKAREQRTKNAWQALGGLNE